MQDTRSGRLQATFHASDDDEAAKEPELSDYNAEEEDQYNTEDLLDEEFDIDSEEEAALADAAERWQHISSTSALQVSHAPPLMFELPATRSKMRRSAHQVDLPVLR